MSRRVLHVTEAASAGTLSAATQLMRAQAEAGVAVRFLYIRGRDTPDASELRKSLGEGVELSELRGARGLSTLWHLRQRVRAEVQAWSPSVLPLHSSWAGLAGRSLFSSKLRRITVYSPHGLSFLKATIPAPGR